MAGDPEQELQKALAVLGAGAISGLREQNCPCEDKIKAVVCLDKFTLCTLLFYSAVCFVSEATAECTLQIGTGC